MYGSRTFRELNPMRRGYSASVNSHQEFKSHACNPERRKVAKALSHCIPPQLISKVPPSRPMAPGQFGIKLSGESSRVNLQ